MKALGQHECTESMGKDVNGLDMVTCRICWASAHAIGVEQAESDLAAIPCAADCTNCKNLRDSHRGRPAFPAGGDFDDTLHVCPNDGNRWWQANKYFCTWQLVTSDGEWRTLQARLLHPVDMDQ